MNRKNKDFIIIVLVLLNLFTLFKINGVRTSLERKIDQILLDKGYLEQRINNISEDFNNKLEEQASLLDDYSIVFSESYDTDKLAASANISLTPKEISSSTTASLQINDNIYPMERKGSSFEAEVEIPIFDEFSPKVALEQDGIQKIQTIEEYYNVKSNYILDVFCSFMGRRQYSSSKLKYDGDIHIEYKELKSNGIEKVSLIKEINGDVISQDEVQLQDCREISVDESVQLNSNDKFSLYVYITDKNGINYKCKPIYFEVDSNGNALKRSPEPDNGIVEISDKNGKVLYSVLN